MAVGLVARGIPCGSPQALAYGTCLRGIDENVDERRTTMTEALVVGSEARDSALSAVGLVFGGVEVNVVGEELDRRLQLPATRRRPFAEGLHAQVGGLASRPLEEVADFGSVIGRLLSREPDGSAHAGMINEECGATAVATIANIHSIDDSRAISNERGWPRFVVLTVVIPVATIVGIVIPTAPATTV